MEEAMTEFKKTVYVAPGAFLGSVTRMFVNYGWELSGPEEADFLCLTGGDDISPALYEEKTLGVTWASPRRDAAELDLIKKFKDKPKLGICRGGQLLNVYSGGRMFQDINNHQQQHAATDLRTKKVVVLSSLHHQMMVPSSNKEDFEIIAVAGISTRRMSYGYTAEIKNDQTFHDDLEAIYYHSTKSLCFQPHPEIGPTPCTDYFFELIDEKYGTESKRQVKNILSEASVC
jgi:gamma-glutamyl-gamma-aminobutyrate hydrolase PuuD